VKEFDSIQFFYIFAMGE